MEVCKAETKENGQLCSLICKALRQRQGALRSHRGGCRITLGRQSIAEPNTRRKFHAVIAGLCGQHPLECPAGILQPARAHIRRAQPHQQ